jgi:hypothetical protein
MIGNFYRDGKCYCKEALKVNDHDFASFSGGSVIPHGIFDIRRNEGYISIGTSKETSEFSCDCIIYWWNEYGKNYYSDATSILILADGGGSNSSRHYTFKEELERCANTIGIEIRIAHFPPYTSKHNPIEHKLFCHVQRTFEGVVFESYVVVKEVVEKAKTSKGLKVFARIVDKIYTTGKKVAVGFKENMKIIFDEYLPQWNYRAVPQVYGNM